MKMIKGQIGPKEIKAVLILKLEPTLSTTLYVAMNFKLTS